MAKPKHAKKASKAAKATAAKASKGFTYGKTIPVTLSSNDVSSYALEGVCNPGPSSSEWASYNAFVPEKKPVSGYLKGSGSYYDQLGSLLKMLGDRDNLTKATFVNV
ncbi:hypothetical protein KIPB_000885, partial [Kipferlia bialata]|eukprot:g885.t1